MNINLIVNSANDAHSISRIREFEAHGYTVKAYGFLREGERKSSSPVTVLGRFNNTLSYHKRIGIYYNGLKQLFRQVPASDDTLWYYLGLDVAMFATWLNPSKRYVYEECDLTQTYTGNKLLRSVLEHIDKRIIRHSVRTLLTSEGFIDYHYKAGKSPANLLLAPNYLSRSITSLPDTIPDRPFDPSHIRFAFVGAVRYRALLSVASLIAKHFPQHEFHFYGYVAPKFDASQLPQGENIFYHGAFKSPDDLPTIYSHVDVVLATYDTDEENVRYAEPNKLYEAIYFRKPIIVSRGTFLQKKAERMKIGFGVDAFDEQDVKSMVEKVAQSYAEQVKLLHAIPKESAVETGEYIETIKHLNLKQQ